MDPERNAPHTPVVPMGVPVHLGIDAGSVSVKWAVSGEDGAILAGGWERHGGRPAEAALAMLRELPEEYLALPAACTGSAGKALAAHLGLPHVNELAALGRASAALAPTAACAIEMGGEDAKFVLLDEGRVADFALNSVCAAGTGSFVITSYSIHYTKLYDASGGRCPGRRAGRGAWCRCWTR